MIFAIATGLTIRVNTDNNLKTYEKVKSVLIQSKFPYNDSKKEIGKSLEKRIGVADATDPLLQFIVEMESKF